MPLETGFEILGNSLDPSLEPCPAVDRCCDAWNRACKTQLAKGDSNTAARFQANLAYRHAMPRLVGYENIRDFVACVAEGILLGAITESQSSRLLYAAQVAQGAIRCQTSRKAAA
jgi:hypothetical protein